MASLLDELGSENASFDSDATISPHKPTPFSLASELEQIRTNSRPPSSPTTKLRESNPNVPPTIRLQGAEKDVSKALEIPDSIDALSESGFLPSDYSGDEWGDPAEDEDPDGRFKSLDRIIEDLANYVRGDYDSAYTSDDDDCFESALAVSESISHRTIRSDLHVITRFLEGLRRLPDELSVERLAFRLIETHKMTSTVLESSLNDLKDQAQGLFASCHKSPEEESEFRSLLSALKLLQSTVPAADFSTTNEIACLEAETAGLVADLSLLSDSLQETRQIANTAGRALKSVKDICHQWQKEIEGVRVAMEWLDANDTDIRLETKATARELVAIRNGFDDFCEEVKQQLVAGKS